MKGYVGKADRPQKRFSNHFTECRDKRHRRANWLKALNARGLKPILQVIDEVPFEHWPQLEVAYIEFFLEQGFDLVNGTPGGESPVSWLGKSHSPESRVKIGAAHRGKIVSPETCAKLSAARAGEKHPGFGKELSQETRAKISAAQKGKPRSPHSPRTGAVCC